MRRHPTHLLHKSARRQAARHELERLDGHLCDNLEPVDHGPGRVRGLAEGADLLDEGSDDGLVSELE